MENRRSRTNYLTVPFKNRSKQLNSALGFQIYSEVLYFLLQIKYIYFINLKIFLLKNILKMDNWLYHSYLNLFDLYNKEVIILPYFLFYCILYLYQCFVQYFRINLRSHFINWIKLKFSTERIPIYNKIIL